MLHFHTLKKKNVTRPHTKDLESKSEGDHFESEESYVGHADEEKKQQYFPSQQEMDDFLRDLEMTKSIAEVLTSILMGMEPFGQQLSNYSCQNKM